MIKILGLVFVFCAFSLFGTLISSSIKNCVKQRNALCELLNNIKINISSGSVPLFEIYSKFENNDLEECGFLELLKVKTPDSLYTALQNCKSLKIGEKSKKQFLEFAQKLGKTTFAEHEINLCVRYLALIETEFDKENEKDEQMAKLFIKLSPIAGLFAVTLLI